MKRKSCFFLLFISLLSSLPAQANNEDKIMHFGAGIVLSKVFNEILSQNPNLSEGQKQTQIILFTAVIAAAKEATDKKWDWGDFGATMLGSFLYVKIKF